VKMQEQAINCQRFDNTSGTRRHRARGLCNERHGPLGLFCSGFLARCRLTGTLRVSQVCALTSRLSCDSYARKLFARSDEAILQTAIQGGR